MASLYLAEATATGGMRVVKQLLSPNNRRARATFEALFNEEARMLQRLNRENAAVPRFHDSFMDSGAFYIVLEFVPGQNLDDYMREQGGALPAHEALGYIRQVVDILVSIHGLRPAPVIHGDIKPSNLIRRPDGSVVLIDFGLARFNVAMPSYVSARTSAFGTPGYTPMEQWEGHPTPASDIFALGATLHHLLTGRNPRGAFSKLSRVSLNELSQLTTFQPVTSLVPGVPPMLETLVMQMLKRRAVERPSAVDLKGRLTRVEAVLAP
jgi:serine/threonine protein kinase